MPTKGYCERRFQQCHVNCPVARGIDFLHCVPWTKRIERVTVGFCVYWPNCCSCTCLKSGACAYVCPYLLQRAQQYQRELLVTIDLEIYFQQKQGSCSEGVRLRTLCPELYTRKRAGNRLGYEFWTERRQNVGSVVFSSSLNNSVISQISKLVRILLAAPRLRWEKVIIIYLPYGQLWLGITKVWILSRRRPGPLACPEMLSAITNRDYSDLLVIP